MSILIPILLICLSALADDAGAGEDQGDEELVVEDERPRETASESVLEGEALEAFPARSADELLQAMPGLHQSAHGGHGKAYQYFVRGFDAVHGADLAVILAGIPLNEPGNVHGHGYLDLHFLPTVLGRSVDLHKGSSRAEVGDFGVAASADFHLGLAEPGLLTPVGGGPDRSLEIVQAIIMLNISIFQNSGWIVAYDCAHGNNRAFVNINAWRNAYIHLYCTVINE